MSARTTTVVSLLLILPLAILTVACGGGGTTSSTSGGVLYAAAGRGGTSGNLYRIDPATGASTLVGPIGFPIGALAVAGDGTLYGVTASNTTGTEGNLVTINRTTGAGTLVAPLIAGPGPGAAYRSIAGLSFRGGTLYGWVAQGMLSGGQDNELVTIDTTTGAVSPIGGNDFSGGSWEGNGLAFSPTDTLYASSYDGDNMLLTIDRTTGVATKIANFTQNSTTSGSVKGFTFIGATLYAIELTRSGGASLVTIALGTAVTTPIGTLPDVAGLAYAP